MEYASCMSGMSQSENKNGFIFRKGQREFEQRITADKQKAAWNIELPTGYGKTICAAIAYRVYQKVSIVSRVLIVVPTVVQLDQYTASFENACSKIGFEIKGVKRIDMDTATLRYHRENLADVFVVTIGKLCAASRGGNGFIFDLLSQGKWLLIADEHHHYATDQAWGDSIKELNVQRTLAMSATPIRRDGCCSIFGNADLRITLEQAAKEHAIKRIRANVDHYFVDIEDIDGNKIRLTTESIRDDSDSLPENFSAWETRRQLRYLTKYISPILSNSIAALNVKLLQHPGQHQMIVFAMSCKHAESVCKAINLISMQSIKSDWVGVGPDGRDDKINTDVVNSFKTGKIDCLVQVNKASEGFDVSKASVLVFLHLMGGTPLVEQQIGRGLRRNYGIDNYSEDICDIFVPADSELVQLIQNFERITKPEIEEKENSESSIRGPNMGLFNLPQWIIIDAEHDKSETFFVINKDDPRVRAFGTEMARDNDCKTGNIIFDINDDKSMEMAARVFAKLMTMQFMEKSVQEKLESGKDRIKKAVKVCASNYVKLRNRNNPDIGYNSSIFGDVIKKIHSQWKFSNPGHDSMTEPELRRKYEWLEVINSQLQCGEAPRWLAI